MRILGVKNVPCTAIIEQIDQRIRDERIIGNKKTAYEINISRGKEEV
jgi:hypothetical protein